MVTNMMMKPSHASRSLQRFLPIGAILLVSGTSFAAVMHWETAAKSWEQRSTVVAQVANPTSLPTAATPPAKQTQRRLSLTAPQANYLVRTTMKSLHDALQTGNYTVLHNLGGPTLQSQNSPAQLAARFEQLAARKLDLATAILRDPILTLAQNINGRDAIRIDGYFSTAPSALMFRMAFELKNGKWAVADLAVDTGQVAAVGNQIARGGT
jgi:hypothetical protein